MIKPCRHRVISLDVMNCNYSGTFPRGAEVSREHCESCGVANPVVTRDIGRWRCPFLGDYLGRMIDAETSG